MSIDQKRKLQGGKAVIALGTLTLLFGILTSILGALVAPIYAGLLAGLFLFDKRTKGIAPISVALFVIAFSIILGNFTPVAELIAALSALLMAFMYSRRMSKAECAGYLTALFTLMFLSLFVIYATSMKGEFSFDAVKETALSFYEDMKRMLLQNYEDIEAALAAQGASADTALVTEEQITLLLDSLVAVIPSLVVILGFIFAGISLKVFTAVVRRFDTRIDHVFNWVFFTGSIFAYFYIVLALLSFIAGTTDVFGIAVANIYNVFMVVYAYVGFNFARALLAQKRSVAFSTVILLVIIAISAGFALTVLSFLGVYFTIARNKAINYIDDQSNNHKE